MDLSNFKGTRYILYIIGLLPVVVFGLILINFFHIFSTSSASAQTVGVSIQNQSRGRIISTPTSTAADAGGLDFNITSEPTGVNLAKKDTVTGGSTNVDNYQIYVSVNTTGGTIPNTDSHPYAIAAAPGSVTDATTDVSGAAALNPNSWGFALASFSDINYDLLVASPSTGDWASSKWAKLPYVPTANVEDETTVSGTAAKIYDSTTATSNSVDVYYGMNINNELAAGTYQTTVTYTLIGTVPPPDLSTIEYMQDATPELCANSTVWTSENNTEYTLKDRRDEQEYVIRKLADGNCWMVQNFRMTADTLTANGHATTLDSTDTDINDSTPDFEMPANVGWTTSAFNNTLKGAADATLLPINTNSASPASGDLAYARGAYYTWCTATADCSAVAPVNTQQPSSLCPKNWKLPYDDGSSTDTNMYYTLTSAQSTFAIAFNYHYPQGRDYYSPGHWYPSGGYIYGAVGTAAGAYWWSNTSHTVLRQAWGLSIRSTTVVTPATGNLYRVYGLSVRCFSPSS